MAANEQHQREGAQEDALGPPPQPPAQGVDGHGAIGPEAQQQAERREHLINAAIREGRTTPAAKASWLTKLQVEGEVAEQQLASLAPGLAPVAETGHDQQPAATEDLSWFGAAPATTSQEG